jgi:hypothetical protein
LFFFFVVLGFELRAYTFGRFASPFMWWFYFQDRVSWTFCPGWLQTMILLISASWVARSIGLSHWGGFHPYFCVPVFTWSILTDFCLLQQMFTFR